MSFLRLLGIVDIISALVILFSAYNVHWILTYGHAFILLVKGVPSMLDGPVGIVMGLTDIITAVFIVFAVTGLLPVKIVLVIILVYKGAVSFL